MEQTKEGYEESCAFLAKQTGKGFGFENASQISLKRHIELIHDNINPVINVNIEQLFTPAININKYCKAFPKRYIECFLGNITYYCDLCNYKAMQKV